jgi:hypothetical protein
MPGNWPDVEIFLDGLICALEHFECVEANDSYIDMYPGHARCPGHISSK